jgi:hypothetical protein
MKFMDADPAEIYLAGASNYPQVAQKEYLEAMRWAEKWGLTDLDPKSVAVRDFFIWHEERKHSFS